MIPQVVVRNSARPIGCASKWRVAAKPETAILRLLGFFSQFCLGSRHLIVLRSLMAYLGVIDVIQRAVHRDRPRCRTIAPASVVPRVSIPDENPYQLKNPFHPSSARESYGLDAPWPRPFSARFRAIRRPRRVNDPPRRSRSTHSLNLGAAH